MATQPINEEFFNTNYINKPVFVPASRDWKVRFVEKGKWTEKIFNTESKALNFYFDKLRLFKYWVMSEFKENTK